MGWPALTSAFLLFTSLAAQSGVERKGATVAGNTGEISGVVTTATPDREPLRRATISLTSDVAAKPKVTVSDDNGRFSFPGLPPGRYSLAASKPSYLSSSIASTRTGDARRLIALGLGERIVDLRIKLLKGSVISGTVRDETGAPAPRVVVLILTEDISSLTGDRALRVRSRQLTDSRGQYRAYGLLPGDYLVSATLDVRPNLSPSAAVDAYQITDDDIKRAMNVSGSTQFGAVSTVMPLMGSQPQKTSMVNYIPVYYPGASSMEGASIVSLKPEEERSEIDLQLRLVSTATIWGTTLGPDGRTIANVEVQILGKGPHPLGLTNWVLRAGRSDSQGRVVLPSMGPGEYSVFARDRTGLWGTGSVIVDGRDASLTIPLRPGVTIAGRARFEGSLARPDGIAHLLPAIWTPSGALIDSAVAAQVSADGSFAYTIPPGTYRLRPSASASNWLLESLTANGVDIADVPFEVGPNESINDLVATFTDVGTEISGTVQDAASQPVGDLRLVIFPADSRFWVPQSRRIRHVQSNASGRYSIQDLPPGDYLMTAFAELEEGRLNDRSFISALAATAPIKLKLSRGEKRVQNVRVGLR